MHGEENTTNNEPKYEKIYEECCKSYHRVDDFRAKLLGFLPLVTGASLFVSLSGGKNGVNLANYLPEIGIFGTVVTLGLLVYELKGIQKCTQFIEKGLYIEHKGFQIRGQFFALCENASPIFNEPVASGLIYSVALAAWTYVILYDCKRLSWFISGTVFFVFFASVYLYWKHVSKGLDKYWKCIRDLYNQTK